MRLLGILELGVIGFLQGAESLGLKKLLGSFQAFPGFLERTEGMNALYNPLEGIYRAL